MKQRQIASIYEKYRTTSDEEWLGALYRSVKSQLIDGCQMPSFPDEALQVSIMGSSNEHALLEGFAFYREIRRYALRHNIGFGETTSILDFGCGWGRNYRFLLKDVPPGNLVGIDVDPHFVDVCRSSIPMGNFYVVKSLPPTQFTDGHFDLVYAYSVFSHLSEHAHLQWLKEFRRILKPGGLFIVTTHSRDFLQLCQSFKGEKDASLWLKTVAEAFSDVGKAEKDYNEGKYVFRPTGGGGIRTPDFYGDTLISPGYVRKVWSADFEIIDYVDDAKRLPQAMIVAQKLI